MGSVVEEWIIQGDHGIHVRFRVDEVSLTHSSHLEMKKGLASEHGK